MPDRVVVIADPGETVDRLHDALAEQDIEVVATESVREALLEFDSEPVDAILVTASLSDGDVLDLLHRIRTETPRTLTVLLIDPGDTDTINSTQAIGIDRVLVLDTDTVTTVAELTREELDNRDLVGDRRRERALSGALLAGLSAITTMGDSQRALSVLLERLVATDAISVAWTSKFDTETGTFEPEMAVGIDRGSLRSVAADRLDLDAEGPVRFADDDSRRVTVLLRADDLVTGALHLYLEPPGLVGPERRLLASAGRALGRIIAGEEMPEGPVEPSSRPDVDTAAMETRSASTRTEPQTNGPDRPAVEVYGEVIAHELRNHLDVAQSYLRLGAEVEGNEDLERVSAALSRIESVIKEAEAVAGHRVRDNERVSVDIGETAQRVWNRIDNQEADLTVADPGTIRAHQGMFDLLLENLFRNAVTHAGQDVSVTVGALQDGFYVEDDGPGIPPEDREAVFEWGFTGRTTKDGFGLAIVKRIGEAHGWSVSATESSSGGARFEFVSNGED